MSPDTAVFDQLVARHLSGIHNFLTRLVGSDAAPDLAQETFLRAWRARHRLRPDSNLKAWLYAIARNAALDWLRRRRETPFSELDTDTDAFADTIADPEPWPEALALRAEIAADLERALQTLPARYRSVVLLHDTEDLTFEAIGTALGLPMNTVKSQYRRALIHLRRSLEDRAPKPAPEPFL